MRKFLVSMLLLIVLVGVLATNSIATTNAELIEFAKSNHTVAGKSIGLTSANKVKVERYLTENPVTDAQAGAIMAKANELIALMESAGVSDPAELSSADKERLPRDYLANLLTCRMGQEERYNGNDDRKDS